MPTYPLTLPTNVGIKDSEFRLERRVAVTESQFTGAQQVHEFDYALWKGNISYPPMKRAAASEFLAFILQLRGKRGTFLFGDPDATSPRGNIAGAVTVNGDTAKGATQVSLQTSQNSTSDLFKKGDYLQFGSASTAKLYMIVEDTSISTSGGLVTVTIEPKLKVALGDGDSVVYSNPKGVFRLLNNDVGWSADHVSRYGISLAFQEAI